MAEGVRLLDTGPLVALLSSSDRAHARCVSALTEFRGELITTEAVLTEAMHLLRRVSRGRRAAIEFFLAGGARLVPMDEDLLVRCARLIETYANLSMDFADATLVAVAEVSGIDTVLTLDRRDFSVYRAGRRAFKILP